MGHLSADLPVDRLVHVYQGQAAEGPERQQCRAEQQPEQPEPLPQVWVDAVLSCV